MKLAKSLDSMVTIKKADKEVDASRLLSLMGLGVRSVSYTHLMVVVENVQDAYDLVKACERIKSVNLGRCV